eukprot:3527495-Prymnesium_polylepis.1
MIREAILLHDVFVGEPNLRLPLHVARSSLSRGLWPMMRPGAVSGATRGVSSGWRRPVYG